MAKQTSSSQSSPSSSSRCCISKRWLCDCRNLLILLLCGAWLLEQFHLQFLNTSQFKSIYDRFESTTMIATNAVTNQTTTTTLFETESLSLLQNDNDSATITTSEESKYEKDKKKVPPPSSLSTSTSIPSWRIITECSAYATDCPARLMNKYGGFQSYPFSFWKDSKHDFKEWTGMPKEWMDTLEESTSTIDWNKPYIPDYIYKPEQSEEDIAKCIELHTKELSYEEQLKAVLERIGRNEELGSMVIFTISDISYAKHEIHDFFEMSSNDVVGFYENAAFMVALDVETIELGCKYDYPVIASSGVLNSDTELRSQVQSTKFEVSRDVLKLGVSFLFYEMDIYWLQSPIPTLKEHMDADIIVSSHFDNPWAPNIGIYVGRSGKAALEFFEVCLDLQMKSPKTHDQVVFSRVRDLVRREYKGDKRPDWEQMTEHFEEVKPEEPKFTNKVMTYELDTLLVSSHVHVQTNEHTLAVHPLCGAPLQTPHGKMMMAKEVGAWYGFQGPNGEAGYYKRKNEHRRYLLLDGRAFGGFATTQHLNQNWGYYHDENSIRWALGLLVVLARRLNRILILPNIHSDYSNALLWWVFDTQTIEDHVDFRETNFPSNIKSWATPDMPFNSVARTALMHHIPPDIRGWRMFSQYNDGDVKAWDMPKKKESPLMDWVGYMQSDEEMSNAEALFVNPAFVNREDAWSVFCRPSRENRNASFVANEVVDMVDKRFKWCKSPIPSWQERAPAKMTAELDCYGRGEAIQSLC